jgi:protein SCO1
MDVKPIGPKLVHRSLLFIAIVGSRQQRNAREHDLIEFLARINCPHLVLHARIEEMVVLRRHFLIYASWAAALPLTDCDRKTKWHEQDISGALPALAFNLTDAMTDRAVTAADFRGKVTLLYFGYTQCPDFCPTTLTNLAAVLHNLGNRANQVRILFVTVDPNRDSLTKLRTYVSLFAPQIVGLRGTPDQLAALARRYRVAYSVTPAENGHPYTVTHSSIVYVFDQDGDVRLLVDSMATQKPDIAGATADLRALITRHQPPSLLGRIEQIV